jgi:uncharacterized membrane protein YeaQ/YmgE (transglycosylase-associated protein family)
MGGGVKRGRWGRHQTGPVLVRPGPELPSTGGPIRPDVTAEGPSMLILGIILFGVIAGWVARTLLGRSDLSWGRTILFGLVGSFVGGLLFSLLAGDGLALRPSGLIGSILGAIILILVDQLITGRRRARS